MEKTLTTKLLYLSENHAEELEKVVNKLYSDKTITISTRSPKEICHFKALGKNYNSNKFIENYISFINDVSGILTYNDIKNCLGPIVALDTKEFSKANQKNKCWKLIRDSFYITTYTGVKLQKKHIKKLADKMGIQIDFSSI
jgi:hypothetical protein